MPTLKSQALQWWNTLALPIRHELFMGYKRFTSAQSYNQLTKAEIQNIWAVQTTK